MATMQVTLKHSPNPDIAGGYWDGYAESGRARKVDVASVEEASKVCRAYIEHNDLGGGNWTGGDVRENGKVIGKISYNGRFHTAAELAEWDRKFAASRTQSAVA